jgi:hypothetical protein
VLGLLIASSILLASSGSGPARSIVAASVFSAATPVLAPEVQVGGQVSAMAADSRVGRLYVARGTRLEIHPDEATTLAMPLGSSAPQAEALTALAPAGDVLWAVGGAPGGRGALRAFDVHDPAAIHVVADLPQRAAPIHLAVSAGRAWLSSGGEGLDVIDVSVPWAPRVRGRVSLPGPVLELAAIPEGVLVLAGPPETGAGTPVPVSRVASLWRVTAAGNERPVAARLMNLPRGSNAIAPHGRRVVVAGRGQGVTIYDPGADFTLVSSQQIPGFPLVHDLALSGDSAWLATSAGLVAFDGMDRGSVRYDAATTLGTASSEIPLVRVLAGGANLWAIEGPVGSGRAWVVPGAIGGVPAPAHRDPAVHHMAAAAFDGDEAWLVERNGALSAWGPRAPEAGRSPRSLVQLPGEPVDIARDAATGIRYVLGSAGVQAIDPVGRPLRMVVERREDDLARDYVAAVADQGRVLVHASDPVGTDVALLFVDRTPYGREPIVLGGSPVTAIALDGTSAWVATAALVSRYDVTDPARPVLLGEPSRRASTSIRALAASGSHLYVLDAAGMLIVDDHATAPRILGSLDLGPSDVAHLALDGTHLWAAWSAAGARGTITLALIDVSDPSAPTELARRVVTTAAHVFEGRPPFRLPQIDLEAAADTALLTLGGASTIWRRADPPSPPTPWAPVTRVSLPWAQR